MGAEDEKGFRTLYSVWGSGSVSNPPMYLVIHRAIGRIGGRDPNPTSRKHFRSTMCASLSKSGSFNSEGEFSGEVPQASVFVVQGRLVTMAGTCMLAEFAWDGT